MFTRPRAASRPRRSSTALGKTPDSAFVTQVLLFRMFKPSDARFQDYYENKPRRPVLRHLHRTKTGAVAAKLFQTSVRSLEPCLRPADHTGVRLLFLVQQRDPKTVLTLPLLFTVVGFALSGPLEASVSPKVIHEGKKLLAEVTLILVLFADASHVRFRQLAMDWMLPARMLVIGMPLTIALGTVVVTLLNPGRVGHGAADGGGADPGCSPWAGRSRQPCSAPYRPDHQCRKRVERDGLALPFVLLGASLASMASEHLSGAALCLEAVSEVVLGVVAG